MHVVSSVDPASALTPVLYKNHSAGFRRATYVNRHMGSVHMGTGICYLDPQGSIDPHLHSFEESFYVLEGELEVQIGEQTQSVNAGNFGLISTGTLHRWRNVGTGIARWLEMQSPQPRPANGPAGLDTFFMDAEARSLPKQAEPSANVVGYFDEAQLPRPGGPSQMEGFNPTTGVAIKMFVDRSFGAVHHSLFLIQYQPGAKIDLHDHTFEESYFIVSGQVRAQAEGQSYELGPGDVIWTSVGCVHCFENLGAEPVRWIETQAPLPPVREVFRFEKDWVQQAHSDT